MTSSVGRTQHDGQSSEADLANGTLGESDRADFLNRFEPDATPEELDALNAEWTDGAVLMAIAFGF